MYRSSDGNGLALSPGHHVGGAEGLVEVDADLLAQDPLRLLAHAFLVEDLHQPSRERLHDLAPEEEVVAEIEGADQGEVLVDRLDPQVAGMVRVGDLLPATLDFDGTGVRRVYAHDHLDQCRLPGAVVAHEADDLPGTDLQARASKRLNTAEALGDSFQSKERYVRRGRGGGRHFSLRRLVLHRR